MENVENLPEIPGEIKSRKDCHWLIRIFFVHFIITFFVKPPTKIVANFKFFSTFSISNCFWQGKIYCNQVR